MIKIRLQGIEQEVLKALEELKKTFNMLEVSNPIATKEVASTCEFMQIWR